jgi:class 3 adenylate cyclase
VAAGAPLRARIGIHTGNAVAAEGVYTGLAVHRAARICAIARGGQVLVSQATQTIIEEEEEPGFMLLDLAAHAEGPRSAGSLIPACRTRA